MLNWECSEWSQLFTTFKDFQVLIVNNDNRLMGFGHTIPLYWEKDLVMIPDSLKTLIEISVDQNKKGCTPNTLLALAAVVSKDFSSLGLSFEILKAMKDLAHRNNLKQLIVPVRPTLKHKYPLITIDSYSKWLKDDNQSFDPWLRVHKKLNGEIFKTSQECMFISGNVSDWESWTGLKIPGSGQHIIEGGLNPLFVDIEKDYGIYKDPCIWIRYFLNESL